MWIAWGLTGWLIAGGGVVLLWIVLTFNDFVRLGNRVNEAFSGVDVQLERRHDLVPNLVRVVRGYAKHEKETLEDVVEARQAASAAEALPDRAQREASLASSLGRLFALVERYPDLKADKNFRQLQSDLVEIEDALQYARRYYNGTVRDFNTRIQRIPANLLAGLAGRRAREFFELDDASERSAPRVVLDADGDPT
jgi:LemA protein